VRMMLATAPPQKARRFVVAVLAAAAAVLPACSTSTATTTPAEPPAKVEAIAGAKVKKVTLTQRASERLALKTAQVSDDKGTKVVPYSAVIYDNDGGTWVYTVPQPLSYVRESVSVLDIQSDHALLSAGPAVGTTVVSEGAAMLYGTELGVGK
jgi:hypothetical protein